MDLRFISFIAAFTVSGMAAAQIGTGASVNQNGGIGTGVYVTPDNNNGIGNGASVNNGIGNGASVNNSSNDNHGFFHFGDGQNGNNNGNRNTGYSNNGNNNNGNNGNHGNNGNNSRHHHTDPWRPTPRPGTYVPEPSHGIDVEQREHADVQVQRATVFVDIYSYKHISSDCQTWAMALHNKVVNGLIDTHRINVIDISGQNGYDIYDGDNDRDGSILRARRQRMRQAGGTYALEIQVCGMDCHREINRRDPRMPRWTAEMEYYIRLVDLATGQVVDERDHDPSSDYATQNDPNRAIDLMNAYATERAKYMALNDFHISGDVLQVISLKGSQAKEVAINVGSEAGAVSGTKFDVYAANYVGGQLVKEKIGRIKVHEVKGPRLAYAKVKDGGEAIYQFYHSGRQDRLYIETGEPGIFDY